MGPEMHHRRPAARHRHAIGLDLFNRGPGAQLIADMHRLDPAQRAALVAAREAQIESGALAPEAAERARELPSS